MITRRQFQFGLAGTALLAATLGARAGSANTTTGAKTFMEDLRDRAVAELSDPNLPNDERARRFEMLFASHFDLPTIGRFVLGPYWRKADEAQRGSFMEVFEAVMVNRFAPLFAGLNKEKLKIGEARPDSENAKLFYVPSTVLRDQGEPYSIGWKLRTLDSDFKVVDVVPEGVSMAITLRSEYTSAIQQNGGKIDAFTEQLRQKVTSQQGN